MGLLDPPFAAAPPPPHPVWPGKSALPSIPNVPPSHPALDLAPQVNVDRVPFLSGYVGMWNEDPSDLQVRVNNPWEALLA